MQQLFARHGYYITDRSLRFVSIRLNSRPVTRPFAGEINLARKHLSGVYENYAEAREERMACTAEIGYLDSEEDAGVMDLSRKVLVLTKNDRNAPLYRKLFPIAPSEAMSTVATASQEQYVLNIINCLDTDPNYKDFTQENQNIKNNRNLLKQATEQRHALMAKEAQANTEYRIAKDDAQRLYNHLYHRLVLTLPETPLLVESFFFPISTAAKEEEEEDDTTNSDGTAVTPPSDGTTITVSSTSVAATKATSKKTKSKKR